MVFSGLMQHPLSLEELLGKGELLIITIAIATDGASDLIGLRTRFQIPMVRIFALICCWICIIMVVLAASTYGFIMTGPQGLSRDLVAEGSLWIFGFALISSMFCKIGSEA
jgi:hypothetical protein